MRQVRHLSIEGMHAGFITGAVILDESFYFHHLGCEAVVAHLDEICVFLGEGFEVVQLLRCFLLLLLQIPNFNFVVHASLVL